MTDERKEPLGVRAGRAFLRRRLAVGNDFDINKGGHFDARSGCINVWCAPEDKPACWDAPVEAGGLDHPRAYVGGVYWEWPGNEDVAELYVEADAYELVEHRRRRFRGQGRRGTFVAEAEWRQVLDWLTAKARELVRLAQLAPDVVGTRCPFCPWVLPAGALLNDLVGHVAAAHPEVRVTGLVLSDPYVLQTAAGEHRLEAVERFGS